MIIVTGSGGLIGSEISRFFHKRGYDIAGIDNNMRSYFFGPEGSVNNNIEKLKLELNHYLHFNIDLRSKNELNDLFKEFQSYNIDGIIHCAAQPSHDWAAKEPITDFDINARATLLLLEMMRKYSPEAPFIFCSTNKVYGDTPNNLPLIELETRWELLQDHKWFNGIDESMSVDNSTHSIFGVSKLAADIMVQEYGRYFGMNTAVFRGGCLTGPAHASAELHGFLNYLVKCIVNDHSYTIFGYKGKQVRDNIHSYDVCTAFWEYFKNPRPAAFYNLGGTRYSNISMLEAITFVENSVNKKANIEYNEKNRIGDHIWYISNMEKFKSDYPNWTHKYNIIDILSEMIEYELEKNSK